MPHSTHLKFAVLSRSYSVPQWKDSLPTLRLKWKMHDQNCVGALGLIQYVDHNIHLLKRQLLNWINNLECQLIFQIHAEYSFLLTSHTFFFFGTNVENMQFWIHTWHLIVVHSRTICHLAKQLCDYCWNFPFVI